ncbi:MAG: hypothetical protein KGK02_06300 [Rhodospirillales bacterium]|nr:hypothetical protein [Rhodospirillales bacterium]
MEPQTTGVPAFSPVRAAASGVTPPTTCAGATIGGNIAISSPINPASPGDQLLVASSASKAPTASA